jgi:hypothetical protein
LAAARFLILSSSSTANCCSLLAPQFDETKRILLFIDTSFFEQSLNGTSFEKQTKEIALLHRRGSDEEEAQKPNQNQKQASKQASLRDERSKEGALVIHSWPIRSLPSRKEEESRRVCRWLSLALKDFKLFLFLPSFEIRMEVMLQRVRCRHIRNEGVAAIM